MPAQITPTRARTSPDPRVVVVDGYTGSLSVRRGCIVVKTGQTERVIGRVDAAKTRDSVARIIILSRAGSVTLEALRWARALDVSVTQVSRDGSVGFCSPGALSSDARIVRCQVLAGDGMPNSDRGVSVMRELLLAKMRGQHEIIVNLLSAEDPSFERWINDVTRATTVRMMLSAEGNAASAYWRLWKKRVFVPWSADARKRVPAHWVAFNGRASVFTQANGYANISNRGATDFINACLNYAYKIAETEALYACHVLGLHPGIGIAHGTHEGMPGMALDILEALRPIVDHVVLSYFDHGNGIPFEDTGKPAWVGKENAREEPDGTCLLSAPMTTHLASAVSMAVASDALRYAELVVRTIAPGSYMGVKVSKDVRLHDHPVSSGVLADDITVADVIPDAIWDVVSPFIPVRHATGRNSTGDRAALAAIIAREVYGASWATVRTFSVSYATCQSRLAQWKELGVWSKILAEVTRPGVSVDA